MYTWAVHVKRLLCTYDAPVWPRLTGLQTNLRHPWPTHVRIHTFKNPWSGDTKTPLCLGETHPFEDKNRLGSELLNFWTLTLRVGRDSAGPELREMGGAPRNPSPRNHFLVWIVKSPGCHCKDAFGGALPLSPTQRGAGRAPRGRASISSVADCSQVAKSMPTWYLLGGTSYLPNATRLIQPRLFYACFVVSRAVILCHIIRHF